MNNNKDKITIPQLCSCIETATKKVNFNGFEISVKPYLTPDECNDFIINAAAYILKKYVDWKCPVWIDRVIRAFTILTYTDIEHNDIFNEDFDAIIPLAYETHIYAQLVGCPEHPQYFNGETYTKPIVNVAQYYSLLDAISATINRWLSIEECKSKGTVSST